MCTDFILNILFFICYLDLRFYFFSINSALRKDIYKEYLDFCDVDPSKALLNQVTSTRWLSLEKCVKRLLHHWPVLTSYFNSHIHDVEKPERVRRVAELLRKHEDDIPHLRLCVGAIE